MGSAGKKTSRIDDQLSRAGERGAGEGLWLHSARPLLVAYMRLALFCADSCPPVAAPREEEGGEGGGPTVLHVQANLGAPVGGLTILRHFEVRRRRPPLLPHHGECGHRHLLPVHKGCVAKAPLPHLPLFSMASVALGEREPHHGAPEPWPGRAALRLLQPRRGKPAPTSPVHMGPPHQPVRLTDDLPAASVLRGLGRRPRRRTRMPPARPSCPRPPSCSASGRLATRTLLQRSLSCTDRLANDVMYWDPHRCRHPRA